MEQGRLQAPVSLFQLLCLRRVFTFFLLLFLFLSLRHITIDYTHKSLGPKGNQSLLRYVTWHRMENLNSECQYKTGRSGPLPFRSQAYEDKCLLGRYPDRIRAPFFKMRRGSMKSGVGSGRSRWWSGWGGGGRGEEIAGGRGEGVMMAGEEGGCVEGVRVGKTRGLLWSSFIRQGIQRKVELRKVFSTDVILRSATKKRKNKTKKRLGV